jgi:hypothetical protein
MASLHHLICAFILNKGQTDMTRFTLIDNSDGQGIKIDKWDYEFSGPSAEELQSPENKEQATQVRVTELVKNITPLITNPKFLKFMFPTIDKTITDWLKTEDGQAFLGRN